MADSGSEAKAYQAASPCRCGRRVATHVIRRARPNGMWIRCRACARIVWADEAEAIDWEAEEVADGE